jgi:hypothetical protein
MKIDLLVFGFMFWIVLAMASGLFVNRMSDMSETDNRIWCYVRTVSSIDGVILGPNQVVRYTRGGIDILEKCVE